MRKPASPCRPKGSRAAGETRSLDPPHPPPLWTRRHREKAADRHPQSTAEDPLHLGKGTRKNSLARWRGRNKSWAQTTGDPSHWEQDRVAEKTPSHDLGTQPCLRLGCIRAAADAPSLPAPQSLGDRQTRVGKGTEEALSGVPHREGLKLRVEQASGRPVPTLNMGVWSLCTEAVA